MIMHRFRSKIFRVGILSSGAIGCPLERSGGADALPGTTAPNNDRRPGACLVILVEAAQLVFVEAADGLVGWR